MQYLPYKIACVVLVFSYVETTSKHQLFNLSAVPYFEHKLWNFED